MDVTEAIRNRRSIRQFLDKDVPQELIAEVLEEAQWAPSWGNTQPWEIMVITGNPLAEFKKKNKDALMSGVKPNPEIIMPTEFQASLKYRYVNVGKQVLQSLNIERGDHQGRLDYYGDMFNLFDAPALIIVLLDKNSLLEYGMLDIGLYLQTLLLSVHEKGLGSIVLAAAVNYPDILRTQFSISEEKTIIMGAALGYPDPNAPVNNFDRQRAPLNEVVTWVK